MGLPYDPNGKDLWVDIYAWEFGRDIEPSSKYGRYFPLFLSFWYNFIYFIISHLPKVPYTKSCNRASNSTKLVIAHATFRLRYAANTKTTSGTFLNF
jgi:hypothetical protein